MRRFLYLVASTILTISIFYAQSGFAETSEELKDLKNEVKAIKERQSAMQKDLQEMKKLLTSRAAAPAAPAAEFKEAIINVQSAPSKGSKEAKLALIEFSDYQ